MGFLYLQGCGVVDETDFGTAASYLRDAAKK
jgi:hypothetical protein